MRDAMRQPSAGFRRVWIGGLVVLMLLAAALLGVHASRRWLVLIGVSLVAAVLLKVPQLGVFALVTSSLVSPADISTGTDVQLNLATLLVPALVTLWVLGCLQQRAWHWASARVNTPLILFLLMGLLSLILGNVFWDPAVAKSGRFWLVQLAQWAVFVFAALAFWLMANLKNPTVWLPRLTWFFLALGGGLAVLRFLGGSGGAYAGFISVTFIRAPFWVLLAALTGGQLLFNSELGCVQRVYLCAVLAAVLAYTFVLMDDRTSNWVGIASVAVVLLWLRFPHRRRALVVVGTGVLLWALLSGTLYEFAGGDQKWEESGASRLVLIERVAGVTLRNPVTGLGPASYRQYAGMEPLLYQRALYWHPRVSSHNNYIDLFAHTGLLGVGLFLWYSAELWHLGLRLSHRVCCGFFSGYVRGMTAAWIGSLVIMLLADWMLPFVYNIGFSGFQASLLVWLFLGGLVGVDQMSTAQLHEYGRTYEL